MSHGPHAYGHHHPPSPPEKRIHLVQGEHVVTSDPNAVLVTLLGSCVAACIRDPVAGVGGMNHFLLPGEDDRADAMRRGVHAMEMLVNGLLTQGARRERLEAKLFGGARMVDGLTDVGSKNGAFAERFLEREGIKYAGGSLGGDQARRIQFWPVSGRVRQLLVERQDDAVFQSERVRVRAPVVAPSDGAVELF